MGCAKKESHLVACEGSQNTGQEGFVAEAANKTHFHAEKCACKRGAEYGAESCTNAR